MNAHIWLEKAGHLAAELERLEAAGIVDEAVRRVAIARWLRAEFSEEPPEDTATLALFPSVESTRERR